MKKKRLKKKKERLAGTNVSIYTFKWEREGKKKGKKASGAKKLQAKELKNGK
jgi:hypothetical protein